MTGHGWHKTGCGLIAGTLFGLAIAGCTGLHLGQGRRSPLHVAPSDAHAVRESKPVDAKSAGGGENSTLDAVAEFLERTKDYQLPSASAPSAPPAPGAPPSGESTAPASATAQRTVEPAPAPAPIPRDAAYANAQVSLTPTEPARPLLALPVVRAVTVKATTKVDAPAANPTPAKTVNEPLEAQPREDAASVDRFLAFLEERARRSSDFDTEWEWRLAQLAFRRAPEKIDGGSALSPDARRTVASFGVLTEAVRAAARNPMNSGEEALAHTDAFREILVERCDPAVAAIALCRKVVTFGVFEELADVEFVAGRTTPCIVYSEIRNLRSESNSDGQLRTQLATRLELLTAAGESVWQHEEPEIVDLCRRRRTDFFIAQRVTWPATLRDGEYVLKVMVEDKLSGKTNEGVHRFTIHAPSSLAQNR